MTDETNAEALGSDSDEDATTNVSEFKAITSQEQLDAVIQSRLARERGKYKDYDELRTQVDGFETSKTEAIEAAKAEVRAEFEAERSAELIHKEVLSAATALGFNDPEDALTVLKEELPLKDDKPDLDELATRVSALAEAKPYLVAATATGPKPRPKPKAGEKVEGGDKSDKLTAAAALRQYATGR